MGRITPTFRQIYEETISGLKTELHAANALTPEERDRFINSLIEDKDLKKILLSCNKNKELLAPQESLKLANYPRQNIVS